MLNKFDPIISELENRGCFALAERIRATAEGDDNDGTMEDEDVTTSSQDKIKKVLTDTTIKALTRRHEDLNDLLLNLTSRPGASSFLKALNESVQDTVNKMVNVLLKKVT